MNLPANAPSWKIAKIMVYFQKKNESANMSFAIEKSIGASIEDYERSARQLTSNLGINAHFGSIRFFTFKGLPAFKCRGRATFDDVPARFLTITVKRDDFFYIVTCMDESNKFDSSLPEFEKIVESFKFIKQN